MLSFSTSVSVLPASAAAAHFPWRPVMEISLHCPWCCHSPCTGCASLICPKASLAPRVPASSVTCEHLNSLLLSSRHSNSPFYFLPYVTHSPSWYLHPGPCPPTSWQHRSLNVCCSPCLHRSLWVQRLLASSTEATPWWAGKRRWSCMARPPEMAGQGKQE